MGVNMDKTVVELFAGVGGFRCGLNNVELKNNEVVEDDTWDFVWVNQWEPSTKTQAAYDCYVERFGESENHVNADISLIDKTSIPNHTLLVGGFPCQDYSVARSLSNEKGIEGKKGVLWWQIAEILEKKQPPFILLENVDRLLKSPSFQRGRDFGIILKTLWDNGYGVEWRVINAAEYGFPQKRRRVFIFAYHKSTKYYQKISQKNAEEIIYHDGVFASCFPVKVDESEPERDVNSIKGFKDLVDLSDRFIFQFLNAGFMHKGNIYTFKTKPDCNETTTLGDIMEKNEVNEKYFLTDEKIERMKYLKGSKKIERTKPNGEKYFFSEGNVAFPDYLDRPARTLLTSESTINRSTHIVKDIRTGKLRTLTPVEAERIQMFPDNWTNVQAKSMTERRRYFMMGNALVIGVVERLGKHISKIIEEE